MKANPVSRHCGGGRGGEEGGRPQHGAASRGCLLQGLSEWLSEEMPESVSVSASLEVCKVFYIQNELFGADGPERLKHRTARTYLYNNLL